MIVPGSITVGGDRGQAYTLEGILAGLIVMTAWLYGLQVVDVAAYTSDSGAQAVELDQQTTDLLAVAADEGALRSAVLCYDNNHPVLTGGASGDRAAFESMLNQTFDEQFREYKIYFEYWEPSGERNRTLVTAGSDSTVSAPVTSASEATYTVSVFDDEYVRQGSDCATTTTSVADASFYAEDVAPDQALYNVVEVRILAW